MLKILYLHIQTGLARPTDILEENQSVERQPFKLVVEGSSPSFGDFGKCF
jgi:hypothetical protein